MRNVHSSLSSRVSREIFILQQYYLTYIKRETLKANKIRTKTINKKNKIQAPTDILNILMG
jgi:hypothetical protein